MLQTDRLRNAQQINLESVDEKIKYMEKCDKDYEELIESLKRLSSDHRLEIMVPLTKKAFMPGELVHTGEVMVYLGDNWFVNRTVTQGIEIALRRREKIASELAEFHKCLDNIRNKMGMTSELEEGGIVEELTEEDIARVENRHKAREAKPNVPRPRPAFSSGELEALKTRGSVPHDEDSEDEREGLRSCLRHSSSSSQGEEEDNVILFSHSTNPPQHGDSEDTIHPGNLHLLLRTPEEKAVIEKVHKKSSRGKQFDINACVIEERPTPAAVPSNPSSLPTAGAVGSVTTQRPAAGAAGSVTTQRPVSRFKMNRST